jgi:uncharacterized Zn finger protein (UPF0148 family)
MSERCPHCGKRLGAIEAVAVSARDSRVEDPDAVPTEALRALHESASAMDAASSAAAAASRAVTHATAAVARIEVQRERQRRSSQTIPAVKPEEKP